jgi:hypothetical protein
MKLFTEKTIRVSYLSLAVLALSIAGAACNSNDKAPARPAQQVQKDQGPAWKLTYQADAADEEKTEISGAYGFTITADGNFIVGPGPQGQTLTGKLSAEEFSDVTSALQPVLQASLTTQAEDCAPTYMEELSDSLTLIRNHQASAFLHKKAEGEICAQALDADSAVALRDIVLTAVQAHYPLPFPGECLNGNSGEGCWTANP